MIVLQYEKLFLSKIVARNISVCNCPVMTSAIFSE